jgi:DNA repair protein SbcD/Mre11
MRNPEQLIAQIRLTATDVSHQRVWIEKVILDTTPDVDIQDFAAGDTSPGRPVPGPGAEWKTTPASLDGFKADLRDLTAKLASTGIGTA